jgi:hypothetical protein
MSTNLALVQASRLLVDLSTSHPNVEVWPDEYVEEGWEYFSVMSVERPIHRKVGYVRVKGERIERRTYDSAGDDLWIPAE